MLPSRLKEILLRFLGWTLPLGLLSLIVCVSIPPLSDWTQEIGSCRGAKRVERDVEGSDVVTRLGGTAAGTSITTDYATTTFTLVCAYNDELRLIENDTAVLRGFGVAFLLGAIPGALIAAVRSIPRSSRLALPNDANSGVK